MLRDSKKGLSKSERNIAFDEGKARAYESVLKEELEEKEFLLNKYFHKSEKEAIREILNGRI